LLVQTGSANTMAMPNSIRIEGVGFVVVGFGVFVRARAGISFAR
jgi:hypothetical protein